MFHDIFLNELHHGKQLNKIVSRIPFRKKGATYIIKNVTFVEKSILLSVDLYTELTVSKSYSF